MQVVQALGTKGVAAVHQNAGNPLANVEFFSAIIAEVKAPGVIVALNEVLGFPGLLLFLDLLEVLLPLLPE